MEFFTIFLGLVLVVLVIVLIPRKREHENYYEGPAVLVFKFNDHDPQKETETKWLCQFDVEGKTVTALYFSEDVNLAVGQTVDVKSFGVCIGVPCVWSTDEAAAG